MDRKNLTELRVLPTASRSLLFELIKVRARYLITFLCFLVRRPILKLWIWYTVISLMFSFDPPNSAPFWSVSTLFSFVIHKLCYIGNQKWQIKCTKITFFACLSFKHWKKHWKKQILFTYKDYLLLHLSSNIILGSTKRGGVNWRVGDKWRKYGINRINQMRFESLRIINQLRTCF